MPAKVLWLIKGLGLGGAEKLLALSAPYLDRRRYEYQAAYLLPWKTALVADLQSAGVPVTCLNHRISGDPRVVYRIARLLRSERIDILHVHLPYTAVVGRLAARLAGTPRVIYTEHNLQERYRPVTRFLNQVTMGLSDLTIAVSEEVRRSLLTSPLVRNKNVRTILNGVDVDLLVKAASEGGDVRGELGIPADRQIVGVVNVFRVQKRLDVWIRAARIVAQTMPDVVFVLVGDGPVRGDIEAQARRDGLDRRVYFTGLRHDAPRLMAAFDVFMLSSEFEGLPVAVLEAMALRIPVVATRVGGLPAVIDDGYSGFLVEPGNPEALADQVTTLLRAPALRQSFADAGAVRVREQFSTARMVRETEDIYRQVLDEPAHAGGTVPDPLIPGRRA